MLHLEFNFGKFMNNLHVETSHGSWLSEDGKSIPFTKETYQIPNDELSSYSSEITK
jgi:hypothetical protein